MAKPRRPRGPRSTWEPKPAPAGSTALESAALESASPVTGSLIDRPAELPADAAAEAIEAEDVTVEEIKAQDIMAEEITAVEVFPVSPSPAQALAVVFAEPFAVGDDAAPAGKPEPIGPLAPFEPMRPVTVFQMTFLPERIDLAGIGDTITGYMRGESAAAAAHMRALGGARSPADMIRLQVGEFQRAADASLTCWSQVARKASRAFAYR